MHESKTAPLRHVPGRASGRAAAWTALLLASCGPGQEPPPSVILVSVDTLRADHLGLYGYERETSPYLDRLAQESVVFERAFSPAPWTLISHMTMLTGLYPNQHGVVSGDWALADETPLLAERLRASGYHTVALFYEGWIHARHGFDRGFDVFRPHENAEQAEQHLQEISASLGTDKPFFLFLHLFDVHSGPLSVDPGPIYDCPPPYDELFLAGAKERIPAVPEGELWLRPGVFEPQVLEGLTALYDGGIRYVDDKLEGWFEDWRERGWLENTLIIVTSDHGESLGQRGLGIRDHGGPYQEGIRVPLIVRAPDRLSDSVLLPARGSRVPATVHLADVVPTVLHQVGLEGNAGRPLPGFSLLGDLPSDRTVYGWSPSSYEMVVRGPYKYLRLVHMNLCVRVDLQGDPEETTGATLSEAEFEATRSAFLTDLPGADSYPPALPVISSDDDQEILKRLNQMGYTGTDH